MKNALILFGLISLISCGKNADQTKLQLTKSAIIRGTIVKSTDLLNASVVAVYNTKTKYLCTGTLISTNTVLTAAHCLPDNPTQLKVIFNTNIDYVLKNKDQVIQQSLMLPVIEAKASPTWDPRKNESSQSDPLNTGDIAVLKITGKIPANYVPATMLTDSAALKIGIPLTVVGFGVDFVDFTEINPRQLKNLERDIADGRAFCDDDSSGKHIRCYEIEMSGEGILRTTEAMINFLFDSEIQLSESKTGSCSGDSGGPAFFKKDGKYFLIGVTSRGSSLCNQAGLYTNVLSYKSWINEMLVKFK